MQLILDIGNTQAKIAVFEHDSIVFSDVQEQISLPYLAKLFQNYSIKAAIISNVGVKLEQIEAFLSKSCTLVNAHLVSLKLPFVNKYATPSSLGNDRVANAAALRYLYPNEAALCIDMGTCLKFDMVNANGEYLGGSIAPGLNMRFKAMNAFTARLPLIHTEKLPSQLIGDSTKNSLLSGAALGMLNEIKQTITEYRLLFSPLHVVITGGDAQFFAPALKNNIFAQANLTLIGLKTILSLNA